MPPVVPDLPSSFTLDDLALLLGIVLIAGVSYLAVRRLLTTIGARLVAGANPRLAALLQEQQIYATAALLTPAVVFALADPLLWERFRWAYAIFTQFLDCYVILVIALGLHKLLIVIEALITETQTPAVAASLTVVCRWLRVANAAAAAILALGVFASVQVTWVLTIIGVIVAMGSIVFSDMIYNAVSRLVLKGRGLLHEGDWLEIPALQINGQVKTIGPQLIQVQNWDNTLATVPPRYLLTSSFRNWQQMYHVDRRRMMRSLNIDIASIRPLDDDLMAAVRELPELASVVAQLDQDPGALPEALTNVGLYRLYLMRYLEAHPKVARDAIRRVTNEDAVGQGLPLLLLAYLTETEDLPFRLLDAAIYEHALASAPRFGLRIYQAPAGADLRARRDELSRL
jgi:miniconductance mechanosensitive channel